MTIPYEKLPSPCYVLDLARLRRNLRLIQEVQQRADISVILALKGFAMWRVFPLIREYLDGATASSLHEARLIYEEMGQRGHIYAPAYIPDEIDRILDYCSYITFNSLNQYRRFRHKVARHTPSVSPGLRVNPEYSDVGIALYNPSSPASRLGTVMENLEDGLPEGIEGLHFHTLCESPATSTVKAVDAFIYRYEHFFSQLKWVNFGGGHLMTRAGYDIDLLVNTLKRFREEYGLKVILEPGSAVAWGCGELVSTVLDIVDNRGTKTAILDISFTAHMPDTLEMPYRPRVLGATDPIPGRPSYRLGAVSCLAGDFMTEYSFDHPLQEGDKVVFSDQMHYTMVKTSTFNGVRHPAIALWHEDGRLELVREFGYEDYKNRLS